jgi:predicted RNA-binding protein with RPS1 domain
VESSTGDTLKILLGSGGMFAFLGVIVTVGCAFFKNRMDTEIALRKLENEEEEQRHKRDREIQERAEQVYKTQIAYLEGRIDELEDEIAAIKKARGK